MHRSTDALHAFQRVANRAVSLFGGIQRAPGGFGAGFGVVGDLLHRNRELFDGADEVFVISWSCCVAPVGHIVRGIENLVGARADVDCGLADALENFGEVVEHEVDGVDDVAEGVFVTLPRMVRSPRATWLIVLSRSVMLRCSESCACWFVAAWATFGGVRLKFSAMNPNSSLASFRARATVTRREPLGEFREFADRFDDALAQHESERQRCNQRQGERAKQSSAGGSGKG